MCLGVAPSGLPMPKSMMSSPRRRAAHLHFAGDVEDVGGQALNAGKLFHDDSSVRRVDQVNEWIRGQGQEPVGSEQ